MFSLSGKNIFISGGCGLIGSAVSEAIAKSGANTFILDVVSHERASSVLYKTISAGNKASFLKFDITDLESIDGFIENISESYGRIDGWVNTAYPRTDDWGDNVENLSLEAWRKNVDMQLNSYAWISRAVALKMSESGGGSIVNFGSTYGVVSPDFGVYKGTEMTCPMAYSAIKGGVTNLSRYMAAYFGNKGVRVNTLCPGGIFNDQDEEFIDRYEEKTPLGRMGTPEDIAYPTVFLLSEAARYITGETLMVDGGWTAI